MSGSLDVFAPLQPQMRAGPETQRLPGLSDALSTPTPKQGSVEEDEIFRILQRWCRFDSDSTPTTIDNAASSSTTLDSSSTLTTHTIFEATPNVSHNSMTRFEASVISPEPIPEQCCKICFDPVPSSSSIVVDPCGHVFCVSCLSTYVSGMLEQKTWPILCPMYTHAIDRVGESQLEN